MSLALVEPFASTSTRGREERIDTPRAPKRIQEPVPLLQVWHLQIDHLRVEAHLRSVESREPILAFGELVHHRSRLAQFWRKGCHPCSQFLSSLHRSRTRTALKLRLEHALTPLLVEEISMRVSAVRHLLFLAVGNALVCKCHRSRRNEFRLHHRKVFGGRNESTLPRSTKTDHIPSYSEALAFQPMTIKELQRHSVGIVEFYKQYRYVRFG